MTSERATQLIDALVNAIGEPVAFGDAKAALYRALREIPGASRAEPTLDDVLAWLRARPGVSWVATITDIEEVVAALRGAPFDRASARHRNSRQELVARSHPVSSPEGDEGGKAKTRDALIDDLATIAEQFEASDTDTDTADATTIRMAIARLREGGRALSEEERKYLLPIRERYANRHSETQWMNAVVGNLLAIIDRLSSSTREQPAPPSEEVSKLIRFAPVMVEPGWHAPASVRMAERSAGEYVRLSDVLAIAARLRSSTREQPAPPWFCCCGHCEEPAASSQPEARSEALIDTGLSEDDWRFLEFWRVVAETGPLGARSDVPIAAITRFVALVDRFVLAHAHAPRSPSVGTRGDDNG